MRPLTNLGMKLPRSGKGTTGSSSKALHRSQQVIGRQKAVLSCGHRQYILLLDRICNGENFRRSSRRVSIWKRTSRDLSSARSSYGHRHAPDARKQAQDELSEAGRDSSDALQLLWQATLRRVVFVAGSAQHASRSAQARIVDEQTGQQGEWVERKGPHDERGGCFDPPQQRWTRSGARTSQQYGEPHGACLTLRP